MSLPNARAKGFPLCELDKVMMTKHITEETGKDAPMRAKSKLRGWLLILAVALATAAFFVLGTLDSSLRYELIGI